jgi:CubicO group peptidase (beta-lactamase class C family)
MRFPRRLAPTVVILAASALLLFLPDIGPERYKDLGAMFRIERQRQACSGFAVAVIKEGILVYEDAFGFDGARKKLSVDSPLYLGPSSEILTGALALSMILDRTFSLDEKVWTLPGTSLPANPAASFRPSDEAGTGRTMTIAELVTHSFPGGMDIADARGAEGFGFESMEIDPAGVTSQTGQLRIHRSGLGYRTLALVMEDVSGKTFAELLAKRLTTPLEMRSTSAKYPTFSGIPRGSGLFFGVALPYPAQAVSEPAIPADGIVSTVRDMARFVQYISSPRVHGIPSLPAKNVPALYQPVLPGGNYGYGWRINEKNGDRIIFQGGSIQGFSSNIVIWPERRSGIILLSAQGGFVQSSIVLPSLVGTASRIMFNGSSMKPLPMGRVLILFAVSSFVYLLVLSIQISGAFAWARSVKDRSEASGTLRPVVISAFRTFLGCAMRVLIVVYAPVLVGLAFRRAVTIRSLFTLEPDLAAVLVAACVFGVLRNVSRLVWLYSTTNRKVFFTKKPYLPASRR